MCYTVRGSLWVPKGLIAPDYIGDNNRRGNNEDNQWEKKMVHWRVMIGLFFDTVHIKKTRKMGNDKRIHARPQVRVHDPHWTKQQQWRWCCVFPFTNASARKMVVRCRSIITRALIRRRYQFQENKMKFRVRACIGNHLRSIVITAVFVRCRSVSTLYRSATRAPSGCLQT